MTWATLWIAFRKVPATALIVIGVLIALVIAAMVIEHHGEKKGERATKLAPLQKARDMGRIQNAHDSIMSASRARIAATAHVRADTAHRRAVAADEKYLEARRKVQPVPDSVLNGLPRVAIVAIEQRDSALVRGDLAVNAIRADAYASRIDAAAEAAVVIADSTEKAGLRLQLARTDSVADLALQEAHPRCGMKCGVVIGAVTVVAVVETVLYFLGR